MEPSPETLVVADVPRRLTRWRTEGSSREILALHGFTGAGADWGPLASRLPGSWAAPDLLGHGGSPTPGSELFEFAAQAAGVGHLREALGWQRPLLFGYSFGGRLSLAALLREPEAYAGAVLIGATAGIADPRARASRLADDRVRADVLRRVGTKNFLAAWQRRPLLATQRRISLEARERMAKARERHTAEGLASSLRGAGTGSMPALWEGLGAARAPVLLVAGAEDPKFCAIARTLSAALPRARCVTIEGAGHCAHLEAPERCAAAIEEFLSTLEAP